MKKILMVLMSMVLLISLINAEPSFIKKQYDPLDINIPVYDSDNSPTTSSTTCTVTIKDPFDIVLVDNAGMSFNTGGYFNYTLDNSSSLGEYPYHVKCNDGIDYGFITFNVEVTPTGKKQASILENPILIIFGSLALALAILGMALGIPTFGFIGSIMFLIGGMYTMIYGINNLTDIYTRSIALVFIGLGLIFMFSSAYEWLGRRED